MLFHEVRLSRDQILQGIADALQSPDALVFLDTSLLLHVYDVGAGARDDPPPVWWTPMLAFRSWRGVSDEWYAPGVSGGLQTRGC